VERACKQLDPQFRRVNVEILGNTDPYLHAHVWPRYEWEPAELQGGPSQGPPCPVRRMLASRTRRPRVPRRSDHPAGWGPAFVRPPSGGVTAMGDDVHRGE
jgi:diadenosine tetraphosphate (Ap4A) HIT family hydrolase